MPTSGLWYLYLFKAWSVFEPEYKPNLIYFQGSRSSQVENWRYTILFPVGFAVRYANLNAYLFFVYYNFSPLIILLYKRK